MSDNDYDDIDKTPSTAVLDDNNSEVIIGVSPSTSKPEADDNLDEHFSMNTSFSEDSNDNDEASKIREPSECQLNDNDSLEDSDAMPSSVCRAIEEVSHNDELKKVDQSSSSSTMKQHIKREGILPNITSLESDEKSKMRDVNVAKSAVPSESEADSNDDDEASEEKKSLLYLLNDNDSNADIGITSTSGPNDNNSEFIIGVSPSTSKPELLSQPWKCYDKSIMHQQKFRMMEEYGQENPRKVKLVNGVKFICSEEFLLGKGSDGTRVYLGLGKDGYGKAVKRLLRDNCTKLAKREKDILNEFNAKRSNYVVNYWYLEEEPGTDYLYLILDLCEESLESFVQSSTLQDLQKALPTILTQILKGLADLHSDPCPILHRDLRPSNVLRDVKGNFLIADFGISHMLLSDETSTHWSIQRGAKNWIAPESYNASDDTINKVRYKKESDIMNAGMVAYYVATKGKHPFGAERFLLDNLLNGKPVGLDKIKDATLKDLLSWMLQLEPEDRPSAKKLLKHPYLQTDEENFDFLCDVGNEPEIKKSSPHSLPSNLREQLNLSIDWMDRIDPEFFNHFNKVSDSTWLGCLSFLRNVRQHWHDESRPQLSSCVKDGNYQEYFLRLYKELPLLVHRTIRLSEWKTRPVLKKPFPNFDGAPAIIVMGGVYSNFIREHISNEVLEKLKESAREGYAVLTNGDTAVDAVEKAVSILESSDLFMIGRGSPLNSEGEVECDAMIMDGDTLKTGAVISGRNFKNPVCLARKIMEKTPHSALSGDGALKFAQDNGLDWCEPNELLNGQRYLPHKYFNDYAQYFMEGGPFPADVPEIRPEETDTCDCACAVAIDRDGKLACATSTGGMAGKLKGCVSDTALVGCGGYANDYGAAAATGHGEKLIKLNFTREVVINMEAGSAQETLQDAVNLLKIGKLDGRAGGIAIDRHGNIGKAFKNDLMPWVSIKNDEMKFGLERDDEGNYPFEFIVNNGVV
ncbi:probable serine/threonine-protein kinase ireA [Xenia sp. Carnegie-2017]|uniref:probable serine/threonine-protein kinase ireA n=1 Tax=Xenia sp. Carnegie-2017 TaxID=2897299 RepID=UPI001F04542C|nr:probable serine/threonine-protein kinase ireA [Xenia sp. Carnegie-2017]